MQSPQSNTARCGGTRHVAATPSSQEVPAAPSPRVSDRPPICRLPLLAVAPSALPATRRRRYAQLSPRLRGALRAVALLVLIGSVAHGTPATIIDVQVPSDVVNGNTTSVANLKAPGGGGPDGISLREAVLAVNNDPDLPAHQPHTIRIPAGYDIRLTSPSCLQSPSLSVRPTLPTPPPSEPLPQ